MRQFLYLDTDTVNSIIAQAENGLVQSQSSEKELAENESDSVASNLSVQGVVGGSLAKLAKLEANLNGSISETEGGSFTTTSREIVNKTLHDAAFNIAYEKIHAIEVSRKEEPSGTGDYVELTTVFNFVNFNHLENLFRRGGLIDYIKEKEIVELPKQYEEAAAFVKVAREIIPYNHMLVSADGYLIPLSEKYFRVDPADLGFKYDGDITCVGMVSNVIGEDTDPDDGQNIFATLQFAANEALRKILPTRETNLWVIHPIAVFYQTPENNNRT